MRTIMIVLALFFIVSGVKGQESENVSGKNEISINMLTTLLEIPSISYERLISRDFGLGIAASYFLSSESNYNYSIVPFVRSYFGEKQLAGFYLEVHGILISENVPGEDFFDSDDVLSMGMGISLGGKFLNKKGWIGDLTMGWARIFTNSGLSTNYPRIGINFGKRF